MRGEDQEERRSRGDVERTEVSRRWMSKGFCMFYKMLVLFEV